MSRASIALTEPNEAWIAAMIERQEYSSKTKLINDLVRRARLEEERRVFIRARLIEAEERGFSDRTPEDVRKAVKAECRSKGDL